LQCGIVTFEVDDHDPEAIKQTLRGQSINVSTSTASSSPIDMHRRGINRLVRASVHAYNSEEEIESFVRAIARLR
jgi:selenocysteine lyase/cysteine desulfurase